MLPFHLLIKDQWKEPTQVLKLLLNGIFYLLRENDTVPAHLVTEEVAAEIAKSRKEIKENKTGDADRLAKRMRQATEHKTAGVVKTATR